MRDETPVKIGIYGAGSIGCYLGAMLSAAGAAPVLVGRQSMGERIAGGMRATRYDGVRRDAKPGSFAFSTEAAVLGSCDVIFLCVKSDATRACGEVLDRIARPDAVIVSLQNGISNPGVLRECLGARTVLAGMVAFNVAQIGAARFHCGTSGDIHIEQGRRAQPVADALGAAGVPTVVSDDIVSVQWGKLLYNLNNPVNALSGLPLRRQLSTRAYRQVLAALIREALAVLAGAGIRPAQVGKVRPGLLSPILELPDWLFVRIARGMLDIDENAKTSMLEDLEKGRVPEIDWLNGEIAALGQTSGVATPVNDRVIELVKRAFSGHGPRSYSGRGLRKAVLG